MRIVLAAVSSNHSMSGVSRHAANLVRSLLTRSEVTVLHVLVAPWEREFVCEAIGRSDARLHVHAIPLAPGTLSRNLWYYHSLPAIVNQLRADIVHVAYPSPIRSGAFTCPVVVTLHDLYPYDIPGNFGFPKVLVNRLILRQSLRNATAITCVSDSTKLQLGLRCPEFLPKTVTIFNSVESGPMPVVPSFVSGWGNAPFLLCVAQHRRNKNVILALRAFKRVLVTGQIASGTKLVIIGMPGPESGKIYGFVRASGLSERVVFISGISDAEMSWCYRKCELLLAPSLVEGFGLPVAEAQMAGCRIVCSDISAFREVGSGACKFVEITADSERQFAEAIVASLQERRPLPNHFTHLSPSFIADQYIRLYGNLLVKLSMPAKSAESRTDLALRTDKSLAEELPNGTQTQAEIVKQLSFL